jgi:hypothetical protein
MRGVPQSGFSMTGRLVRFVQEPAMHHYRVYVIGQDGQFINQSTLVAQTTRLQSSRLGS